MTAITVNIPSIIYRKLKASFNPAIRIYFNNETVSIKNLKINLKAINQIIANKHTNLATKLILEKYKVCLLESILVHIGKKNKNRRPANDQPVKKSSKIFRIFKIGFLVFVSVISLIQGSIGSFLGTSKLLLALLPQISNPLLMAATIIMTTINIALFAIFQIDMLKRLLNIKTNDTKAKIYEEISTQIDLQNKINMKLIDTVIISQLSYQEYKDLTDIASQTNRELLSKKPHFKQFKEHPAMKALRWTMTGFGALISALGCYFGAASLLAVVAAPLVGTPIGWAIIGAFVVSGLVIYFAMQDGSMASLFNASMSAFNKVREKLKTFSGKCENTFNNVLLKKHLFKKDDVKPQLKPSVTDVLNIDAYSTKSPHLFARKRALSVNLIPNTPSQGMTHAKR